MATDLRQIVLELGAFYDLRDRTLVSVGAGGGQLVEYARPGRRVIAVDRDAAALDRLSARAREAGLVDRFTLMNADFLTVDPHGDVVLFEFCLHEFEDPDRALEHAKELAVDIVVLDHAPQSRWAWYAAEQDDMAAAWRAVGRRPIRRRRDVDATQSFVDYAELSLKLAARGAISRERIADLQGQTAIRIPMPYRLALL